MGSLSAWPQLGAACSTTRRGGEAALKRELEWASHLGVAAVLAPAPPADVAPLARALSEALQRPTSWQCWVRCPLTSRNEPGGDASWRRWDALRRLCDHSIGLCVALELTEALPSLDAARRWRGEPLKALLVPYARPSGRRAMAVRQEADHAPVGPPERVLF